MAGHKKDGLNKLDDDKGIHYTTPTDQRSTGVFRKSQEAVFSGESHLVRRLFAGTSYQGRNRQDFGAECA